MSRKSRRDLAPANRTVLLEAQAKSPKRFLLWSGAVAGLIGLISLGALANLGALPATSSPNTRAASVAPLNPAMPTVSPTPSVHLAKEYVYAGSRMLAVEDAAAAAAQSQPADLVVWRRSSGSWWIRDSNNSNATAGLYYGLDGDTPAPADFDGDGRADFCVFRPNAPSQGLGFWYLQSSETGGSLGWTQFGLADDIPVPADYDGDGRADIAVWRGSNVTVYVLQSSTGTVQFLSLGGAGGEPVVGDYDGDGRADAAVYRSASNSWIIRQSSNSLITTQTFGASGDQPTTGDYDGDGKFDLALRRDSENAWHVKQSSDGSTQVLSFPSSTIQLQAADVTVAGDYNDADNKTDIAVWRPGNGTWYIRNSADGTMRVDQWGMNGDTPISASFIR